MKHTFTRLLLLAMTGFSFTKVNAQEEGDYKITLEKLSNKYTYSIGDIDKAKLQMNKINFLLIETSYMLDSANNKKNLKFSEQFLTDNRNYRKLLSYATKTASPDTVERILDFLSFDVQAKYLADYSIDTLVEVTVKVIKDGSNEELSGYNVFAKPSMSVNNSDIIQFNPTNNAVRKIRPGKKTFWIEKNGFTKEIPNCAVSVDDKNTHLVIFVVN